MRLILASASPQRRSLLAGLGVIFEVIPSSIDESSCEERDPVRRALQLSLLKAQDVFCKQSKDIVIGCDTLVVSPHGDVLEKPLDAKDAERMLRLQSGGVSQVHSGMTIFVPGKAPVSRVSTSSVHFAALTNEQISWWIDSGKWRDRSGSFQIDGSGQLLIRHIEGDWTSIVGLPVFLLGALLTEVGYPSLLRL